MLTRLRLHNFKTFLNFEVEFTRRHLLIGKNNSGKSNLCHALRFLGNTATHDYEKAQPAVPGGVDGFCHWGLSSSSREAVFECTCELPYQGQVLVYEYALHVAVANPMVMGMPGATPLKTVLERLQVRVGDGTPAVLLESDGQQARLMSGGGILPDFPRAAGKETETVEAPTNSSMLLKVYDSAQGRLTTHFKRFLGSFGYYSLSPPLMRYGWTEPSLATASSRALLSYGQNLPMILFQLKNEDEPRYRRVLEVVSCLEPELDSLNFIATPENKPVPHIIMKGGKRAGWENLSDGTLCALAIGAIFGVAEAHSEFAVDGPALWVMIEEPENSLYCGLLPTLWERLSGMAPVSQFIFTSHSPYFIDLFDRDLGSVTALTRAKGITQARSLLEYKERIKEYRDKYDFSLGEQHYKEVFG